MTDGEDLVRRLVDTGEIAPDAQQSAIESRRAELQALREEEAARPERERRAHLMRAERARRAGKAFALLGKDLVAIRAVAGLYESGGMPSSLTIIHVVGNQGMDFLRRQLPWHGALNYSALHEFAEAVAATWREICSEGT